MIKIAADHKNHSNLHKRADDLINVDLFNYFVDKFRQAERPVCDLQYKRDNTHQLFVLKATKKQPSAPFP